MFYFNPSRWLPVLCMGLCWNTSLFPENTNPETHPRLLFTSAELNELRARSKEYFPDLFLASLKRKAKRNRDDAGFLAFAGLWLKDESLRQRGKSILLKATARQPAESYTVHTGSSIRSLGYATDWVHDLLTDAERSQVYDFIADSVRMGMKHWQTRTHRGSNWEASIFSSFVVAGALLEDSHEDAQLWMKTGITGITHGYLRNYLGPDGAGEEPFSRYTLNVSHYAMLPAMEVYRRTTGRDVFAETKEIWSKHVEFFAYMVFPDRSGLCNFGDGKTGLYPVFPFLVKMSAEYQDELAAWYLREFMKEGLTPNNWGMVFYLLWGDAARKAVPEHPDNSSRLSRSRSYSKSQDEKPKSPGQTFIRTGFGGIDDMLLALPGNIASHHGHADKGSYILHAYGELFIEDPYQSSTKSYRDESSSFYRSEASHNTVLVDGAGQSYIRGGGLHDRHYGSLIARVEQYVQSETFDYVRIDKTRTYDIHPKNKGMKKAIRHVIFLRGERPHGNFVVIDDIQKDDLPHTYSHHFQPADDVAVSLEQGGIQLTGQSAVCQIAIVHPEKITFSEEERFDSKFVKAVCDEPTVRLNLITVLSPRRSNAHVTPISRTVIDQEVSVTLGQRRVSFHSGTGSVSIDGEQLKAPAEREN